MKRVLLLLFVLAGCPTPPPEDPPQRPAADAGVTSSAALDRLPRDRDGNIPLFTVGDEVVKLGPVVKDPAYAFARCGKILGACMLVEHKPAMDCARAVRPCQSAEPWNEEERCCPQACVDEALRLDAAGDPKAYLKAFGVNSCFPGLVEQYCAGGGRPVGGCPGRAP